MQELTAPMPTKSDLARQYGVDRRTIARWQQKGWAPPTPAEVEIVQCAQGVPTPAHPPGRAPARHWALGLTSGALGLALAAVGLIINAHYAASLGRTVDERALLATLGLTIDGGAVILLSVAAALWQVRHMAWSVVAFTSWLVFTAASMIATAGFTSQAIGDHAAGRGAAIEQAADLRTQRAEAITAAKAAVAEATKSRDQECGKVGDNCRQRVRELGQRQSELAAALSTPTIVNASVSAADPGAKLVAEILAVGEPQVQKARIAMLTVAPATSALFLAFAVMLLGRRVVN